MRSALSIHIPGTRKLIICLFLGLSAFITAHIVNAFVGQALFVPEMFPPPLPSQDNAIQHSVSPQQLAQDLMTRGLFALPQEPSQTAGSSTGAAMGPPLDVAKNLLLQGTALGIGDEPMAIVQDRSNQQQKLLHLHDRVPNVGELVSIEKTRVLFQDRGQEEWLELAMLTDLEQARRMPPTPEFFEGTFRVISQPPQSPRSRLRALVSPTGGGQLLHILDRRELSQDVGDSSELAVQAQLVVSATAGRFNGIRLELVRFGGLYYKMGLESGDILKRFNGVELREPSMVLTSFAQMQYEHRVKLDIVRNETPRTLTFEIR